MFKVILLFNLIFPSILFAETSPDKQHATPYGPITIEVETKEKEKFSVPLAPHHIRQIFILNDITEISDVSYLKLEDKLISIYVISFTVSLTDNVEPVSNNRVRCYLNFSYTNGEWKISLTYCGNSAFDILKKDDVMDYYFSSTAEEIGLEEYLPRKRVIN